MRKRVLDLCCGPRMFWFNRNNALVVYVDKRKETHHIDYPTPKSFGYKPVVILPDILANFETLPFKSNIFNLVIFDPPHIKRSKAKGVLTKKYGYLTTDWRESMRKGFSEGFRVLKVNGTLIFKWSESEIPLSEIINNIDYAPLLGHRSGKAQKTHWLCFLKNDYQLSILN